MVALTEIDARGWATAFLDACAEQAPALGELDRQAGDGDYGANLQLAVRRGREALASMDAEAVARAGAVFGALSGVFMRAGGTSGPLYGIWFRELANAAGEDRDALSALAAGAQAGVAAVQRLGGRAGGR